VTVDKEIGTSKEAPAKVQVRHNGGLDQDSGSA